jgi:hypothetical protein
MTAFAVGRAGDKWPCRWRGVLVVLVGNIERKCCECTDKSVGAA